MIAAIHMRPFERRYRAESLVRRDWNPTQIPTGTELQRLSATMKAEVSAKACAIMTRTTRAARPQRLGPERAAIARVCLTHTALTEPALNRVITARAERARQL